MDKLKLLIKKINLYQKFMLRLMLNIKMVPNNSIKMDILILEEDLIMPHLTQVKLPIFKNSLFLL
jgi:hypothetical protein